MMNKRWLVLRPRLSIRSTMILVAIIALVASYLRSVYLTGNDFYSKDLKYVSVWSSSRVDGFAAEVGFTASGPEVRQVTIKPAASLACLLKLVYVEPPKHANATGCNIAYLAVSVDGRSKETWHVRNWAIQGGQSTIPAREMPTLQGFVAKLPSSHPWIPAGHTLMVGFSKNGTWVTRNYDTDRLPPEILQILSKTKATIPWMPVGNSSPPAKAKGAAGAGISP